MQKNQELFFNVLKFDWPTEAVEFHFFENEIPRAERIYHSVSAAAFNWVMYQGAIQKWDDL